MNGPTSCLPGLLSSDPTPVCPSCPKESAHITFGEPFSATRSRLGSIANVRLRIALMSRFFWSTQVWRSNERGGPAPTPQTAFKECRTRLIGQGYPVDSRLISKLPKQSDPIPR